MKEERNNRPEEGSQPKQAEKENISEKQEREPHFTEVKNANAAGLGAMSRQDQKLDEDESLSGY